MGKTHTFIASVELEFLKDRHVRLYILPVGEIHGRAFARFGRAIAL